MSDTNWPFKPWFRLAVTQLNIAPDVFWNMAVRDWLWVCAADSKHALSLENFHSLFEDYPDD